MRDYIKKFLGLFLCVVLALGGFSNVFASSNVLHISSVEISSKSAGVEAETPSVENDHVQGDVVFNAQGDHIEYLFTIENTDDYAYRIDGIADNNSTEKLAITYSHGEKIEAKSTASFTMLMEYSEQLVNQEKLDLSDLQIKIHFTRIGGSEDEEKEEDIDVNPDTVTSSITNVVANGALASSAVILVIVFALHGTLPKQLKYAGIGTALLLAGSAISLNLASAAQSEEVDIQFSNIELVGIFENYTVTIDTGNGPVEHHYDYGTPLSEILSRPSKTGYHFDKWVDGNGNTVDENGTITGPIDIVAVMEANKYHVVFDANGGTGSMDSQEFTYDEAAKKLSKNIFERPGYNFAGWATTTDGAKAYDDEEEVRNLVDTTEDVKLYAKWTKLTDIAYTVKHRYAGLTGGYDEVEREEAGPVDEDIYPPVLERDGFNNPATIAPIRINPDGSTVAVLEYSRKSYAFAYSDSEYIDTNESTSAGDYAFETPITVKAKNRDGYQFTGWSDGSNIVSTNNPYTFDLPLDGITLTPTYEANTYHVAFHANGGTGDMAKQEFTFDDESKALSKNLFERAGYEFAGWATSTDGEVVYADKAEVRNLTDGTEDVDLYAKWTANTYSVVFHANEGTGSMDDQTFTYDEAPKALAKNTFERAGYSFAGWAKTAVGEVEYTDEQEVQNLIQTAGTVDLYAKWTANTYNVSFHANGGDGSMNDQSFTYGEAAKALTINTFTREGYGFAGWSTTAGGEVEYADGASVQNITSDIDLYAKWAANTYNVIFRSNDGNDSTESQEFTFDESAKSLRKNTFERAGYSFAGWATTADGTKVYDDEEQVQNLTTTTEDVNLYAKWTANTYNVTFHANGGDGSMENQPFTYGEAAKALTANSFTRTGYSFAGWATTADGEKAYDDEAEVQNLTEDIDLYALWIANTYSVTFHANGGDGSMENQPFTYGEAAKALTANSFTRTGYSFAGWAKTAEGEVEYVDEAQVQNLTSDMVLYAKWTANTYHVVFHSNDGNDSTESQEFVFDEVAKALRANTFTRAGYDFAGWATSADGEVVYADEQKVQNLTSTADDVNLYAKWTANTYNVSFHANGGDGSMDDQSFTYGEAAKALTANTFTRAGYSFAGWATSAGGEKEYDDEAQVQNITSDIDLYARWVANNYNVVFHSNDGNDSTESQAFIYDEPAKNLRKNTFERIGYSFAGWATTADGVKAYDDEEQVQNLTDATNNVDLYAVWTADTYYVRFHANGGDGSMSEQSFTYSEATKALTANTFTRTGYSFAGWATSAGGEKEYDDEAQVQNLTSDIDLYALWNANTYHVIFHSNDGNDSTESQEFVFDEAAKALRANSFAREGYSFAGWAESASGEVVYANEAQVQNLTTTTNDVNLYAKWTANTYYVTFHANNGAGSMENQPFTYGEAAKALTANAFTRTGYSFAGWTESDSGEVVYADEAQVQNLTSDIDLYAKWTANTYTVVFHSNEGSGLTESQEFTYDEGLKALRKNTFTYAGYSFAGWAESASGQVVYNDEEEVENLVVTTEDVNLYAKWEARTDISYLVIHHYEKLTEGYDDVEDPREDGRVDQDVQLPIRHVDGFVDPAIRSVPIAADGTTVEHYYYLRERVDFTLNDPDNHVTTETGTGEYKYGATISLVAEDVPGYGFTGWSDGQSIVSTNASYSFEITTDVTLTPSYVANTYNVIFNANGGTGSMDAQTFTYDAQATALTANTFTRAGYIFAGWATNPNGEIVYTDEQQVQNLTTTTDDFNLYAKWTLRMDIEYTVHHRYENVGSGFTEVDTTEYGSVDTDITPPTAPEAGFDDPVADASTPVPTRISADGTSEVIYNYYRLYKNLTIVDGADISGATSGSYKYGTQFELTAANRQGYEFVGWSLDGGETITEVNATYSFVITEDTILTPVYEERPFYYVYKHDGACDINGGAAVVGDDCSDKAELGYVDTGVKLYDEAHYGLDYEVGFTLDSLASEQVLQATYVNAKYEDSSSTVLGPGMVLRKGSGNYKSTDLTHVVNGSKVTKASSINDGQTVKIIRFNGTIYISINNQTPVRIQSTSGTSSYHDITTTFGASYDTYTNAPWRFLDGTLSNMYIKMGQYDGPTATVTFDAQGGSVSTESATILRGLTLESLPTPTWTDSGETKYFVDWYLDTDWEERVTTSTVFNSDTRIYARWVSSQDVCEVTIDNVTTTATALNQCFNIANNSSSANQIEISLLRNVDAVSVTVNSGKDILFDGGNHRIKSNSGTNASPIFANNGTLRVKNGYTVSNNKAGTFNNKGTLYLDGGYFEVKSPDNDANETRQVVYNDTGGHLIIENNATIKSDSKNRAPLQNHANASIIELKSGTIISTRYSAIYGEGSNNVIVIGVEDGNIDITNPVVRADMNDAVIGDNTTIVKMFDGTLIGKRYAIGLGGTGTTASVYETGSQPVTTPYGDEYQEYSWLYYSMP